MSLCVEKEMRNSSLCSLLPAVIDKAVKLPDLASIAAMYLLGNLTGPSTQPGPSSGANFLALIHVLEDPKRYCV